MDEALGDFAGGDVLVEDGVIVAVGPGIEAGDADVVDASGAVVLPGFVDTHRHTWETALRGIAPDATLDDYNRTVIGTFAPRYRPTDVYVGTAAGAAECLAAGITTLVDWSHITLSPDHADAAVQALRDVGIRAQYACGPKPLAEYWFASEIPVDTDDLRRLRGQYFSSDDALLTMAMAARGPGYSGDDVVVRDWQTARELDLPITCHVGHGRHGRKFEMVRTLHRLGLLGSDITYVHACLLADDEWRLVVDSGGGVSVAALVELQMGHGDPPVGRCLAEGLRPGLSVDVVTSAPGDMFTQMRAVFAHERGRVNGIALTDGERPRNLLTARRVLEMATIDGARVAGLAARTGSLTPGKRADITVIDTSGPNTFPLNDPVAAVVLAADTSNVRHVIVDGAFRKRDGRLLGAVDGLRAGLAASREYLLGAPIPDGSADRRSHP
jgi:cytosine/adenosine deaminase-related metal-dependent hydrolase